MKLKTFELKNYRLHRFVSLDFDPGLTVIEGENESGKSTLVEALHRALFLSFRSSGVILEEMRSKPGGGDPELKLCFETGDGNYELQKSFSGARGKCSLTNASGQSWLGDRAEEYLGELVGAAVVSRARGGDQMRERWGHLWVWQGSGGINPLELSAEAIDQPRLLEQLQNSGQLGVQSQLDRHVLEKVKQRWSVAFTEKGRIGRAGSNLAIALQAERDVEQKLIDLNCQLEEQEQARIEEASVSLKLAEIDQVLPLIKAVEHLRVKKEQVVNELNPLIDAKQKLSILLERKKQINLTLTPNLRILELKKNELSSVDGQRKEANIILEEAVKEAEMLQQMIKKASLVERINNLEKQNKRLKELEDQLGKLVPIDAKQIEILRQQQQKLQLAVVAMETVATRLELIEADEEVLINKRKLKPGALITIETESILEAKGFAIKLIPGGGSKLEEAFRERQYLELIISSEFKRLGVNDVESAARLERLRSDLIAEKQRLEAQKSLENKTEIEIALTNINLQLSESCDSNENLEQLRFRLEKLIPLGRERRQQFNQLDQQLTRLRAEITEIANSLEKQQLELLEVETLLKDLALRHGRESEIEQQLSNLKTSLEIHNSNLVELFIKIKALGFKEPDLINLEIVQDHKEQTLIRLAAIRARLHADGINNRYDLKDQLEASLEDARLERLQLEQDALMLDLLRHLLEEEQTAMATQYTTPVIQRLDRYLSYCTQGVMRSKIEYQSPKGFTNLQWQRGEGGVAWPFSALSGGTKEVLAAALRLAMAEVLAASYNGSLPLVFDDAFSNVDPGRWPALASMLQQAVNNGLQILMFSCDPNFSASLPASKLIKLGP
jgi:DNA repair exonuclease SbcCD ATPase subunit